MTSSRAFLEQLHRRIVTTVALWTGGIALLTFVLVLAFYMFSPGFFALVVLAITFTCVVGTGLTILLRERPLWQMVLPFALSIVINQIIVAVWLPDLRLTVAPFLVVVVMLVSLTTQRLFTVATTVFCTLLAVLIVVLGPLENVSNIPSMFLRYFHAANIATLIIAVWAVTDRMGNAQLNALRIADQRAEESEKARQASEMARQEIEQRAAEQQRLLELVRTLELPVLVVDDQVLLAPLVGNLDSWRAGALRRRILEMVAEHRARVVILDVTGISMIDTEVARALIDTAMAIRLLGARTVVSGIRAAVAQTLVSLNASLGDIITVADVGAALAHARSEVAA
ncbi:MAG: STAS domain-containing protein [Oscillochloridaceae bacterium]|nr:STAS domain-containing protein [Chloroflexaceae bacterium]MDW8390544.1 STAS domain-containing protein [Oscillochloridaceae bacterium]